MSNPDRFKIPSLYKKLLALAIVIGPIYWLMLTDDGRRRTDIVVLSLKGEPTVELRLDILGASATEDKIREFLPQVDWQCENTRTPFGERNCIASIAAFNDTPAHYMVVYFDDQGLSAVKIAYRHAYHGWLRALQQQSLGAPRETAPGVLRSFSLMWIWHKTSLI